MDVVVQRKVITEILQLRKVALKEVLQVVLFPAEVSLQQDPGCLLISHLQAPLDQ